MLDQKYNSKISEPKWQKYWQENNIYSFNENSKKEVYSIDTPPPTVNGKIHMGHLSSYIHIDVVARLKRMLGYEVLFPFGYDDNGLPTERYVEKKHGIRAANLPREEFVSMCLNETHELEKVFEQLYISAGFSSELKKTYSTISPRSQLISQTSFIDLYNKGKLEYAKSPALWCCDCQTSVAISELETREIESSFNYIKFYFENKEYLTVATTRPELLAACDCVFINPKDKKNAKYIGKSVKVPLYNFYVPVMADEDVAIDKGTGIVMCCTFGDEMDKNWQKKYNLEIKQAIGYNGRMTALAGKYEGQKITEARKNIIDDLRNSDLLIKEEPIVHAVGIHDRCGKPIEILVKEQWFINILNEKERLYKAGLDTNWYPESMRSRYLNWVTNLKWNWCISRQRYFGVPFPVWYCEKCGSQILADIKDLPVNPIKDKPKTKCKCGCNSFIPEKDVMDTWATSSLTPQLSCDLTTNKGLSDFYAPMSLRPNAHDNIRVWDFYTIVKSLFHFNKLPWNDLMISGYILAGAGEKLGKSKGNSKNTPEGIIDEYSADVTRYWASSGSMGKDRIFGLDEFKIGAKLVNKIFNASKFVIMHLTDFKQDKQIKLLPTDAWILEKYNDMQIKYKQQIEKYELGAALSVLEAFFWDFCDNYIEIVKNRLYKPEIYGYDERKSGQQACYAVLFGMLKFFAPFLPHITEEIYKAFFEKFEKKISIHLTEFDKLQSKVRNSLIEHGDKFCEVLSQVRKYKSQNNLSMKDEIEKIKIILDQETYEFIKGSEADLKAAGAIKHIEYEIGDSLAVEIKRN